jgi:hypothetical protein
MSDPLLENYQVIYNAATSPKFLEGNSPQIPPQKNPKRGISPKTKSKKGNFPPKKSQKGEILPKGDNSRFFIRFSKKYVIIKKYMFIL